MDLNDISDCKLKIIFYKVLPTVQIPDLSNSIEHCSTLSDVVDSIDKHYNSGKAVFVGCRQQDFDELHVPIHNGRIQRVFILNDSIENAHHTNLLIGVNNESCLQTCVITNAAAHMYNFIDEVEKEGNDSIGKALRVVVQRLFHSVPTRPGT